MMRYRSFGFSEQGEARSHNEDCFLRNEELGLFLLADGMGGPPSGETASRMALRVVEEFFIRSQDKNFKWPVKPRKELTLKQNRLRAAVLLANRRILEMTRADPSKKGMGTTLVGGVLEKNRLAAVNVGDSRLYRVRKGGITQITRDHSLVGEKRRRGMLTDEETRNHPQKHILTSALGANDRPKVDFYLSRTVPEDLYIACSDGVHNVLTDDDILAVVNSIGDRSLYKMGLSLVLKAKLAGGMDDMTVLILSFDPEEEKGA